MRHHRATNLSLGCMAIFVSAGLMNVRGGDLILSEIDLAEHKVELVNVGTSNINASSWWWCNRVNGIPFYAALASGSTIDPALSTATSLDLAPGEILVMDITSGILPDLRGELGLFNIDPKQASTTNDIEDYILWDANGVQAILAVDADIWADNNDSIDVSGMNSNDTIQLGLGLPGNAASEYHIGASSLGLAQSVPADVGFSQVTVSNAFELCFQTVSGIEYRLESSTDLLSTNLWVDAGVSVTGDGSTNCLSDPGAVGLSIQKLYRITQTQ